MKKGRRAADIDASSRVPEHQLGHLDIQLAGIKYPLLDLGNYAAVDVNGATLIYTPGNVVVSGGISYLCITQTTAAPPGVDWRVFDKSYFGLRSDRVWDGGMPIFVGTTGVDGVDALLTPESPPFQNGWTNSLGLDPPVSFIRTVTGWIHISGGFFGGANGTIVFTLPAVYCPPAVQRFVIGTSDPAHIATYLVQPTGDVVFGSVI